MKTKILSTLTSAEGYVSGQELCDSLQVSRTAVWKVINQLRDEGYEIESVSGRGYRIAGRPDCITAEEVTSRLHTGWAAREIHYYPVIDSTNHEAKKLAEQGAPHGTLVLADEQVQGKGRRGRSWVTPAGQAIAMSLLLRPELMPERASMLTLVMGMAVASACRRLCGIAVRIKWPNDIVAEGRKICGILTEMSSEIDSIHYVVIGIGINTGVTEFPPELAGTAVSLHTLTGRPTGRAELIALCMEEFERYYGLFARTQDLSLLREEYNRLLAGLGGQVRVLLPGGGYEGISEGISDRGELIVRRGDGTTESVYAGEVSVRGIYGYV